MEDGSFTYYKYDPQLDVMLEIVHEISGGVVKNFVHTFITDSDKRKKIDRTNEYSEIIVINKE